MTERAFIRQVDGAQTAIKRLRGWILAGPSVLTLGQLLSLLDAAAIESGGTHAEHQTEPPIPDGRRVGRSGDNALEPPSLEGTAAREGDRRAEGNSARLGPVSSDRVAGRSPGEDRPALNALHHFDNKVRYRAADHPNQTAFTPEYLLGPIRKDLGGIGLDPCTTPDNPVGADWWFAPPLDGLVLPWLAGRIFVNPPYGKAREAWVRKCIAVGVEGKKVILLIPAHTDTRIFQAAVRSATAVVLIRGRVKFGVLRPNRRQIAASHPSALIGWNTELEHCSRLGVLMHP